MAYLELNDIYKSYYLGKEEFPVLKGIDLNFELGEFVSILGESGGGKSTLMNIIGGLDREFSGEVKVNGELLDHKKEKMLDNYRRSEIGYIYQSYNLINHLTVMGNVLVSLNMTDLSRHERENRAKELLKTVGLLEHKDKHPNQLSGGQKQRVAIARALASNPKIIIADEPTGALDAENTADVLEILKEIAASGKLVIAVTHSEDVAHTGTRIVRLTDGKITNEENISQKYEDKTVPTIFKSKVLSRGTIWKMGLNHLFYNWKQNILIILGGAIGIFSIMLFLGLGNGIKGYINNQVTSLVNPNVPMVIRRIDPKEAEAKLKQAQEKKQQEQIDQTVKNAGDQAEVQAKSQGLPDAMIAQVRTEAEEKAKVAATEQIKQMQEQSSNDTTDADGIETVSTNKQGNAAGRSMQASMQSFQTDPVAMNLTDKMLDSLKKIKHVKKIDTAFQFNGSVNIILGKKKVVTQEIQTISPMFSKDTIKVGKMPKSNEIVVDKANFAELMEPKDYKKVIGQQVKVTFQIPTEDGNKTVTLTPTISGIADGGSLTGGSGGTFMLDYNSMKEALKNAGIEMNANYAVATIDDTKNVKSVTKEINKTEVSGKKTFLSISVGTILDTVNTITDLAAQVLAAISGISLIVTALMIIVTTYMSVAERTKEIGILRAMGARKQDIRRLFTNEALLLGIFSAAFAILFSLGTQLLLNKALYDLISYEIVQIKPENIIFAALISLFIALIAAIAPSRKAAKLNPITALSAD